jgi:uncharacterized membrane protein
MTTPIVMLALMIGPYLAALVLSDVLQRRFDARDSAALGLALLFTFTGIGHFVQTEPMTRMLPSWIPARNAVIYLTGILELVIAFGFLLSKFRRLTGLVASTMLILFFPANVYAAVNHVPMGGHAWGPLYLLIRTPLQLIMLLWIYWFTLRPSGLLAAGLVRSR